MIDVLNNFQWRDAKFLGDGFDLDDQRVGGVYAVTDPTNGPDTGDWFVEVLPSGQFGVVMQVARAADGSSTQYRVYAAESWGSWAEVGVTAAGVTYDNSTSSLTAENVQDALDELKALVDTKADT